MISPGPLDIATGTITSDECNVWDKHFKITRSDVEEFVARYIRAGGSDLTYDQTMIPESILSWPANGNSAQDQFLAPFYDQNGNGYYEPLQGDYPDYNITGDNDEWSYMEIKHYGGYLMIKEISIQKQKQILLD